MPLRSNPLGISRALLILCALCSAASGEGSPAAPEVIAKAEALIQAGRYHDAVQLLEGIEPQHTPATFEALCVAYRAWARELLRTGQTEQARSVVLRLQHREKMLASMDARATASAARASTDRPSPPPPPRKVATPPKRQAPRQATTTPDGWRPVNRAPARRTGSPRAVPTANAAANPLSTPSRPTLSDTEADALKRKGDAAFAARSYDEALKAYNDAYRRAPHLFDETAIRRWCYCRLRQAVEVINRGPRNEVEWTLTEREIQDVLVLLQKQNGGKNDALAGYAKFLLEVARQRRAPEQKTPDMIRAAEPEEHTRTNRTRSRYPLLLPSRSAPLPGYVPPTGEAARPVRPHQTPFFVVQHGDPVVRGRLAAVLNHLRELVARKLFPHRVRPPWPSPCVVRIHSGATASPDRRIPAPAVTTVERRNNRIVACQIDVYSLPADAEEAILAHEIAHVWLAAASPSRPLPAWADEGIAVLVEPPEKYREHLQALARVRDLDLAALKSAHATAPVFYATAASLANYVRSRYGMRRLLEFARASDEFGLDEAARLVLGVSNLEQEWADHVRRQLASNAGRAVNVAPVAARSDWQPAANPAVDQAADVTALLPRMRTTARQK